MDPLLWNCDRPMLREPQSSLVEASRFGQLKQACQGFVEELLAGTTSCCYWIEESATTPPASAPADLDPTVFFDEDNFYHIKNKRSQTAHLPLLGDNPTSDRLSLPVEEFDQVLECFLRCQSVSMYIGSLDKSSMVYPG